MHYPSPVSCDDLNRILQRVDFPLEIGPRKHTCFLPFLSGIGEEKDAYLTKLLNIFYAYFLALAYCYLDEFIFFFLSYYFC